MMVSFGVQYIEGLFCAIITVHLQKLINHLAWDYINENDWGWLHAEMHFSIELHGN